MAKRDDAPDEVVRGKKHIDYSEFERQSSQPVQREPVQPVQTTQPVQQAPTVVQNPMPTPETPPMQGNYSAYAKYSNQISGMNRANELRQQAAQQGLTALQNANANTLKGYEERLAALRNANANSMKGYEERLAALETANANTQAAYNERLRLADEEANIRKQANEAARQAALQQALGNYGLQKDTLAQQADDAARQAYISRMIAERDLGQQLAAAGYTGGMAESSRLGLLTNYETNRNNILRDRDNSLAAIDLAMRNAEAQTAADIANQNAGFDLQNLSTRGNLYTAMLEAMSQGDTNRANLYAQILNAQSQGDTNLAGLYAQMLNAQSQGDANLANYLGNMYNQDAENEIALANLYSQMSGGGSGSGAGGSGGGSGTGRTSISTRSSSKRLKSGALASDDDIINAAQLQNIYDLYDSGQITGQQRHQLEALYTQKNGAGNTAASSSQASPAAAQTAPLAARYTRQEALNMINAYGGNTREDRILYANGMLERGEIPPSIFNSIVDAISNM